MVIEIVGTVIVAAGVAMGVRRLTTHKQRAADVIALHKDMAVAREEQADTVAAAKAAAAKLAATAANAVKD